MTCTAKVLAVVQIFREFPHFKGEREVYKWKRHDPHPAAFVEAFWHCEPAPPALPRAPGHQKRDVPSRSLWYDHVKAFGWDGGVKPSLFWDVTQCRLVLVYRRFRTAYRSRISNRRTASVSDAPRQKNGISRDGISFFVGFVEKREGRRACRMHRRMREDCIKMGLQEIGWMARKIRSFKSNFCVRTDEQQALARCFTAWRLHDTFVSGVEKGILRDLWRHGVHRDGI
jgi:hypothetical protein